MWDCGCVPPRMYIVTENRPQCGCEVPWQTAEGIGVAAVKHRRVFSGFSCTHTLDFLPVHGPFCQTLMFGLKAPAAAAYAAMRHPRPCKITLWCLCHYRQLGYRLQSTCFLVGHRPQWSNTGRILQVYICKPTRSSNAVCPAICIRCKHLHSGLNVLLLKTINIITLWKGFCLLHDLFSVLQDLGSEDERRTNQRYVSSVTIQEAALRDPRTLIWFMIKTCKQSQTRLPCQRCLAA